MSDRAVFTWIAAISGFLLTFLFWLLYWHEAPEGVAASPSVLPAWNAAFNASAATCLFVGWRFVRAGDRRRHALAMGSAVGFSALFLVTYVVHHATHGDTLFPGTGAVRVAYLAILASHVLTTIVALPMILTTLYYAARGRFVDHRRVARRNFPLWMYVSVTGVAIFLMLEAAR